MLKFQLERLNQSSIRLLKSKIFLRGVSYSDRLCIIGIPTFTFRYRTDTIQVYKILIGYEDIDTKCFFTVDSDSYSRGHLSN